MSGIAGILSFDSQRRQRDPSSVLSVLSEALVGWGPDGATTASHQGAAMVYRALHITPRSRHTRQPLVTEDGLMVTWDGRLDNRRELARRLNLAPEGETTDLELVVRAYRERGQGGFEWLVGDFALALWDSAKRRLTLARDPFAGRPLFFATVRGSILWASTTHALLATGEISPDVDDAWVGAYLIGAEPTEHSPFKAIEVVSPGEAVVLEPAGRRRRSFWSMTGGKEIRLPSDEEYEEAFHEHFYDAVRCRMRTPGAVCCELSGGVDSSAIVCVADRLLRDGAAEASELFTYSLVYDRASGSDERRFIRPVEAWTGRPSHHVLEDDFPAFAGFERVRPQVPFRFQTWPAARHRVVQVVRGGGARVVLSGLAGDQLLWSRILAPSHLADHLARARPVRLLRELGAWHRQGDYPYPTLLWQAVVHPLWCAALRRGPDECLFDFSWLSDGLRSRMPELRARSQRPEAGFHLPSRRMRYAALRAVINSRAWLIDDLEQGYEWTCPYLHRPLVEFCLGVPFDQLVRPHEMRSLHRRALRQVLPEVIANRQCKRGPSEAYMRGLRREWPVIESLFAGSDARIYARGYVHPERFLEHMQDVRFGVVGEHAMLIRALEIEVWLRGLEERSCRAP